MSMENEVYRLTPSGLFAAVLLEHGIIGRLDDRVNDAWDDFVDYYEKFLKDDYPFEPRRKTYRQVMLERFPNLDTQSLKNDYCVHDFFGVECPAKYHEGLQECADCWDSYAPDEYRD